VFSAKFPAWWCGSGCGGGCILRLEGGNMPQSLHCASGFDGDWREQGLIRFRWREKLRGKQEKSESGALKGAER